MSSNIPEVIRDHARNVAEAREVAGGQTVITIDGPNGERERYAVQDGVTLTVNWAEFDTFTALPGVQVPDMPEEIVVRGRPIRHPLWDARYYGYSHVPIPGRDYPPLPTSAEVWAQGFEAGLNWTGGDPADVQNPYAPDPSSS